MTDRLHALPPFERSLLVSITPKGRALMQPIAPEVEAAYAQMDTELGEQGLAILLDQLDTLIASLDNSAEGSRA